MWAAVLAAAVLLATLPSTVRAHGASSTSSAVARAVAARNEAALAAAPREVRGKCSTTERLPGIGRACRTRSDLFRITLPDGDSFTTHGFDAPATEHVAASMEPASAAAVLDASVEDITCIRASSTRPRTTLVYAYPSDAASRYGEIVPALRAETYKMSAFLDAESRALDPAKSQRLPIECDGSNLPVVHEVKLGHDGSSDSFSTITSDLTLRGFGGHDGANYHRYLVYYDGSVGAGIAGMAYLYESDSSKTPANISNTGDQFAMEFRWGNSQPHWDVMLHEAGHNMGAVKSDAPNTSGAGHCNDGQDIMCYADGGSQSHFNSTACADLHFDCGHDDYFDPSPAPGSFLASSWNIAGPENLFLLHVPALDTTPPSRPGRLTARASSNNAINVTWDASTDEIGVVSYRIWRDVSGIWQVIGSTTQQSFTVADLLPLMSYDIAVSALDAAGNESVMTFLTASTNDVNDLITPSSPTGMSIASITMTSVALAWAPASDNVGITSYDVYRLNGTSPLLVTSTSQTRATVTGLVPGRSYSFGVIARDAAGNASEAGSLEASTLLDERDPDTPRRLRQSGSTRHAVTITWAAASDNVAVARYQVYRWGGSSWRRIGLASASKRSYRDTRLRSGRRYLYAVRAYDVSGNASDWSSSLWATTRR